MWCKTTSATAEQIINIKELGYKDFTGLKLSIYPEDFGNKIKERKRIKKAARKKVRQIKGGK